MNYDYQQKFDLIKRFFCGRVVSSLEEIEPNDAKVVMFRNVYVYGNIRTKALNINKKRYKIMVIKEISYNYDSMFGLKQYDFVGLGEVPLKSYNNIGVFYPRFFEREDIFESLVKEHDFQDLTESNKSGISYRKGIYITDVKSGGEYDSSSDTSSESDVDKTKEKKEVKELTFNLLRCSTNLGGPTDNFRECDYDLIDKTNHTAMIMFTDRIYINHVLAQVYNNQTVDGKLRKAKIKDHSDKTKDMPVEGLITFATFYDFSKVNRSKLCTPKSDPWNICYKKETVLTRLRFRLKSCVEDSDLIDGRKASDMKKQFDIILYANSLFMMTLEMNRFYTHEIIPTNLEDLTLIPTRIGYVMRCSNRKAIYKMDTDEVYFQKRNGEYVKLEEENEEGVSRLKETYFAENMGKSMVEYEDFNFSLNKGDYLKPLI